MVIQYVWLHEGRNMFQVNKKKSRIFILCIEKEIDSVFVICYSLSVLDSLSLSHTRTYAQIPQGHNTNNISRITLVISKQPS